MAARPTAEMARRHRGLIVGVKTAHYSGPEWTPVERAVEAGISADVPVMVDFGARRAERPVAELVTQKLRPGDIYTHVFSGLRGEQDPSGRVNVALWEGRKRGVLFDVGHGAGSFAWKIAVPAPHISSVCFAAPNRLLVTTSRMRLSPQALSDHPGSGGLFEILLERA